MSDDIVADLRAWGSNLFMLRAADEIERLRAERDGYLAGNKMQQAALVEANEIARKYKTELEAANAKIRNLEFDVFAEKSARVVDRCVLNAFKEGAKKSRDEFQKYKDDADYDRCWALDMWIKANDKTGRDPIDIAYIEFEWDLREAWPKYSRRCSNEAMMMEIVRLDNKMGLE